MQSVFAPIGLISFEQLLCFLAVGRTVASGGILGAMFLMAGSSLGEEVLGPLGYICKAGLCRLDGHQFQGLLDTNGWWPTLGTAW